MRVPAQQIRRQLVSVFRAWGMSEAHADTTADMVVASPHLHNLLPNPAPDTTMWNAADWWLD